MDAVEECPDSPGIPSPREKVLNLVEGMVDSHPDLWICVTSRPEQDIRMVLEPLACHHISHRDEDRGMTSLTTRALLCAQTERCGNGDRKIRNLLFVRLPSGPMECSAGCSASWRHCAGVFLQAFGVYSITSNDSRRDVRTNFDGDPRRKMESCASFVPVSDR